MPARWGERARPVDSGGRGGAWFVDAPFGPSLLRLYLRGGWAAKLSRDQYLWHGASRTRSTPVTGGGVDLTPWLGIQAALVNPGATLDLEFSWNPKDYKVYFMQGEGAFEEVEGEIYAPSTPGRYTYLVEASWEPHRTVQYYFVIEVPAW